MRLLQPSPPPSLSSDASNATSASTSTAPLAAAGNGVGAFATLVATFSAVCDRVFRAQLYDKAQATATLGGGPTDELELVRTAFMFTGVTRHQNLLQHDRPILYTTYAFASLVSLSLRILACVL